MTRFGSLERKWLNAPRETVVPVGLFGLQIKTNFVFRVTFFNMDSRSWVKSFNLTFIGFPPMIWVTFVYTEKVGSAIITSSPSFTKAFGLMRMRLSAPLEITPFFSQL